MDDFPAYILPQLLSSSTDGPPVGEQWLHEIKLDGYRLLCRKDGNQVDFFTRRGHRWTERFPAIAEQVRRLEAKRLWLDGELVVMNADGRSCFGSLQHAVAKRDQARLAFSAFDLLHIDGLSLCMEPLLTRKSELAELLQLPAWNLFYVDHVIDSGHEFFHLAVAQQLEGIVSKRIDSIYRPGTRSRYWLKSKSTSYPRNVAWKWWQEKRAA